LTILAPKRNWLADADMPTRMKMELLMGCTTPHL
jgi:hypothetical protein